MFSSASSTSQSSDSRAVTDQVCRPAQPLVNSGNRDDLVTEVDQCQGELGVLFPGVRAVHLRARTRKQPRRARRDDVPQRLNRVQRDISDQYQLVLARPHEVANERPVVRALEQLDEAASLEPDEDPNPADALCEAP